MNLTWLVSSKIRSSNTRRQWTEEKHPRSDHHHHVLGVSDDDAHPMTTIKALKMIHWKRKYGILLRQVPTSGCIHIIRPLNPQLPATPLLSFSTTTVKFNDCYWGVIIKLYLCLTIMSLLDCYTSVYCEGMQKAPQLLINYPPLLLTFFK